MSHTPHELHEEFPEAADTLRRMKAENAHFARLADDYHEVNREIHRIEARIEPSSAVREEDLRKRRVQLKDEIAALLRAG